MNAFALHAGSTNHTILLQGETGVGKDRLAEVIHSHGRAEKAFVSVDCGSLTATLTASELMGHVSGAFTDAYANKPGLVKVAEGGTLFLNEVTNMSLDLQAQLLRITERGSYRPVGATMEIQMNTRIIVATNVDLKVAVSQGKFRSDLYHRLNVVSFTVPPLRDRREDIQPLAEHFLRRECPSKKFSQEAIEVMMVYVWPGNVRELGATVARSAFNSGGQKEIQSRHLGLSGTDSSNSMDSIDWESFSMTKDLQRADPSSTTSTAVNQYKFPTHREATSAAHKKYVVELINEARGDLLQAAPLAQVSQATLYRWLEDLDLLEFVRRVRHECR